MLDLKRIRFDSEAVRAQLAKRQDPEIDGALDSLLELDEERRRVIAEVEELKAKRNEASKEIAEIKKSGGDASVRIAEMKSVADRIAIQDGRLAEIEAEIQALLLAVPNTPADEVRVGGEGDGEVVRTWGEPPSSADWRLAHWDLGERLGIIDLERGARLAGSGFPVLTGAGARLQWALVSFMLDLHTSEHGYTQIAPPYLVTRRTMTGTGQLPKMAGDAYQIESDDLWLIPTGEVPITNLHAGEVLKPEDMPRHYAAHTPCFRREAGAAGRETRGINRIHQFDKVELVRLERPEDSSAALEELTRQAATVLERLGLPYRVVRLAAGDMAQQSATTYDIEAWAAGAGRWLEVSSCSNCTDYQARRANIRFRSAAGAKPEFVHTLNGSGLAIPRTLIAILENYQREDGSVEVPEALRPWMNAASIDPA